MQKLEAEPSVVLCNKRYGCDREELSAILTHWQTFHVSGVAALAEKSGKCESTFIDLNARSVTAGNAIP